MYYILMIRALLKQEQLMPSFVFNNSTSTFNAVNSGTMAAGSISYAAPSYLTSGTISISLSRYGVKNGPAISVMVNKSFDTETELILIR